MSWRSCSPGSIGHTSLPPLQQITDRVGVGVGQHITLFLGQGSCRLVSPPALLSSPPGWARQHCPGYFIPCSYEQGAVPVLLLSHPQGWFSHLLLQGQLALLCSPGKVQGPLSQVLQLVRGRDNSLNLTFYDLRVSSPICLRCWWWVGENDFSPTQSQDRWLNGNSAPKACVLKELTDFCIFVCVRNTYKKLQYEAESEKTWEIGNQHVKDKTGRSCIPEERSETDIESNNIV